MKSEGAVKEKRKWVVMVVMAWVAGDASMDAES